MTFDCEDLNTWMPLQMTNEVGKAMFAKAGELGAPVGFMCMKVSQLIVELQ